MADEVVVGAVERAMLRVVVAALVVDCHKVSVPMATLCRDPGWKDNNSVRLGRLEVAGGVEDSAGEGPLHDRTSL